jgi:DNA-directed RNA polymerase specialized sigma24 family protein
LPRDANEAELDALMDRLADGDRSAFDPLYAALRPRAVRLGRARVGAAHAEDVAQATLLRVFSRAAEFQRGRAVLPWFYAIAANESRAIERRLVRGVAAPDAVAAAAPDPETEVLQQEMHRALDRAIADLDDDAAAAILTVLDEAARPDIKPATFRKRLSRAYTRLRVILGVSHVR